jgi:hypothetical protein
VSESSSRVTAAVTSSGELYAVVVPALSPSALSITRARNELSSEPTHARMTTTRLRDRRREREPT